MKSLNIHIAFYNTLEDKEIPNLLLTTQIDLFWTLSVHIS